MSNNDKEKKESYAIDDDDIDIRLIQRQITNVSTQLSSSKSAKKKKDTQEDTQNENSNEGNSVPETKNSEGKISINSVTYTPIYTYKDKAKSSQKFKIIDLEKAISNYEMGNDTTYAASVYNTFKTELDNIKNLIGEEIH